MDIRLVEVMSYLNCDNPMELFYNQNNRMALSDVKMWIDGFKVAFGLWEDGIIRYITVDSKGHWVRRELSRACVAKIFISRMDYQQLIGEPLTVDYSKLTVEEQAPVNDKRKQDKHIEKFFSICLAAIVGGIVISQIATKVKQGSTKSSK